MKSHDLEEVCLFFVNLILLLYVERNCDKFKIKANLRLRS